MMNYQMAIEVLWAEQLIDQVLYYAWQDPHNRLEEAKVPYPAKLNVWGAVGTHVKTQLYYFEENMNSDLYIKVLKTCLKRNKVGLFTKMSS